ncbi:zinc finger, c3HC4 type (RING finger) domain-containing protein [Ditylenchus destructor]|uniref:E3 ubiquitin protein ligase n=1 Tax=Ditylenchus destructor TaxID=166010 RepID=A0AAD4MST8_9BILA|nr:zinc finger, c3HC4 type (RING finger) domain-containing protein [Ditylenchus destructor]
MKYYSDEARRKIRSLEEQCEKLRKELTNANQEEEGLMIEMEATGQAFEDMQEQNQKLVQQLREKDEANLNLMGERIRNNQAQKKVKEEKELLDRLRVALNDQMDAKTLLCHKLEEKEKARDFGARIKDHTIVLEEENRLLKEVLTCPSCKVNRKDAIILKCSHTFCMACLKRRYECRSRKCPT